MAIVTTIGNLGQEINLLISRGDDFGPHLVSVKHADTTPFDLTGCQVIGAMKRRVTDPDPVVSFVVTFSNRSAGEFFFGLPPAETVKLAQTILLEDPRAQYVWDMKIIDSDSRRFPLFYGAATAKASVT